MPVPELIVQTCRTGHYELGPQHKGPGWEARQGAIAGWPSLPWSPYSESLQRTDKPDATSHCRRRGRFLAVVATLDGFGGCVGTSGTGCVAAGREAGAVRAADRAGVQQSGGVPDRRDQPANRETVATRPHGHRQGWPEAALCSRDHTGAVVRREISDRYLSEKERVQIADLRAAGAGVRAIAERTGRSPSTISRELRRNRDPGSGQYRPFTAPCVWTFSNQ